MIINPVYKREMMVSDRSIRMSLVIALFNFILAMVALITMSTAIFNARTSAQMEYTTFLTIFRYVSSIEFTLIIFIMPALTAGSISGERERRTLDLMLTTKMTVMDIVIGKLAASLMTVFILIISSLPIVALVFVYGGVTVTDMLILFLCYVTVALLTGGIGMFVSASCKKSTVATAITYLIVAVVILGTLAIQALFSNIFSGIKYILVFNPLTSFYVAISDMTGNSQAIVDTAMSLGMDISNVSTGAWFITATVVQLVTGIACILLAARMTTTNRRSIVKKWVK